MTIAVLVGIFVTTWMTGRIAKMNASAIFVSLLFWAWLWGVWGMLLSIPIIVIVRFCLSTWSGYTLWPSFWSE